jgi:hypothetical protein
MRLPVRADEARQATGRPATLTRRPRSWAARRSPGTTEPSGAVLAPSQVHFCRELNGITRVRWAPIALTAWSVNRSAADSKSWCDALGGWVMTKPTW